MQLSISYPGVILIVVSIILINGIFHLVRKLTRSRDPLLVWEFIHSHLDLLPVRLRNWLFTVVLGIVNPYSRSINCRITEIEKGRVCGVMKETRNISTPFRCVHAAALVAFGETVGGLALFTRLGKKDRAILIDLHAEYFKVARGLLTASSRVPIFGDTQTDTLVNEVQIKNAAFDTVAKITLTWKTEFNAE